MPYIRLIRLLTVSLISSVLAAPQATPQTSSAEYTSDTAFRDAVLNGTNTYRSQHNATALSWNDTLAIAAREWSEECGFEHSVSASLSPALPPTSRDIKFVIEPEASIHVLTPTRAVPTAKTSPQATKTPPPPSTPGAQNAAPTTSKAGNSAPRPATSRSWCGRRRRMWGAGARCAMGAWMAEREMRRGGLWCASIGLAGT